MIRRVGAETRTYTPITPRSNPPALLNILHAQENSRPIDPTHVSLPALVASITKMKSLLRQLHAANQTQFKLVHHDPITKETRIITNLDEPITHGHLSIIDTKTNTIFIDAEIFEQEQEEIRREYEKFQEEETVDQAPQRPAATQKPTPKITITDQTKPREPQRHIPLPDRTFIESAIKQTQQSERLQLQTREVFEQLIRILQLEKQGDTPDKGMIGRKDIELMFITALNQRLQED